jgi:hypothetical protein
VLAELFVDALTVYALAGVAFALAFVTRGVARVDPHAEGAGLGFRLLIFPAAAALWPVLCKLWWRART